MTEPDSPDLAEQLAYLYGSPSGAPHPAFDENDVAAFASGNLSPQRRAALERARLQDPELRGAVDFACAAEAASTRKTRWAAAGVAAAACVGLVVLLGIRDRAEQETWSRGSELLAQGQPEEAWRMLGDLQPASPEETKVWAFARFAGGGTDLSWDSPETDQFSWRPLSDAEVRGAETLRSAGDLQEATIGIQGFVSDRRPAIPLVAGPGSAVLLVIPTPTGAPLFHLEVPACSTVTSIEFPPTASPLEPNVRYVVELRSGGRLIANRDIMLLPATAQGELQDLKQELSALPGDAQHLAFANACVRHGAYVEAERALDRIPEESRSPAAQRVADAVHQRLWAGR